jgi:hypothetical protein
LKEISTNNITICPYLPGVTYQMVTELKPKFHPELMFVLPNMHINDMDADNLYTTESAGAD